MYYCHCIKFIFQNLNCQQQRKIIILIMNCAHIVILHNGMRKCLDLSMSIFDIRNNYVGSEAGLVHVLDHYNQICVNLNTSNKL